MSDEPLAPIDSQAAFTAAVHGCIGTAVDARVRRIVLMSGAGVDWGAWALDDTTLLRRLAGWLRLPQRNLVLLAGSFDGVPRRAPRFTDWRADWSHAITAWVAPPELGPSLPTLLLADDCAALQLFDTVHWRGRVSRDLRDVQRCHETIDAVLQRSERGFPANVLGL